MYTWEDDNELAGTELDEYSYSYVIKDAQGEVRGLCTTEEDAQRFVDALNAAAESNTAKDSQ
jgi:hypothetical protein